MADRPLILPGWAVRAVLDGRKTQHRVVLKPQPPAGHRLVGIYAPGLTAVFNPAGRDHRGDPDQDVSIPLRFQLKDRLWVRETFVTGFDCDENGESIGERKAWYQATDRGLVFRDPEDEAPHLMSEPPWRSSATMPRWASRLTLRVTAVRVHRVQGITEEDARAEGMPTGECICGGKGFGLCACAGISLRDHFTERWAEQHGPDAWERNPWVLALTFRPIPRNIDMEA